jgi:hypothetical protein
MTNLLWQCKLKLELCSVYNNVSLKSKMNLFFTNITNSTVLTSHILPPSQNDCPTHQRFMSQNVYPNILGHKTLEDRTEGAPNKHMFKSFIIMKIIYRYTIKETRGTFSSLLGFHFVNKEGMCWWHCSLCVDRPYFEILCLVRNSLHQAFNCEWCDHSDFVPSTLT